MVIYLAPTLASRTAKTASLCPKIFKRNFKHSFNRLPGCSWLLSNRRSKLCHTARAPLSPKPFANCFIATHTLAPRHLCQSPSSKRDNLVIYGCSVFHIVMTVAWFLGISVSSVTAICLDSAWFVNQTSIDKRAFASADSFLGQHVG